MKFFTRRSLQPPTTRTRGKEPPASPGRCPGTAQDLTSAGTRTPGRARLAHSPKENTRRPLTALNPHPSSVPPKGRYTARRSGTKHQVSQGNRTHCRKGEEAASVIHLIGNTGKKKRKGKKAHLFSAPSGRTRRTVTLRDPLFVPKNG